MLRETKRYIRKEAEYTARTDGADLPDHFIATVIEERDTVTVKLPNGMVAKNVPKTSFVGVAGGTLQPGDRVVVSKIGGAFDPGFGKNNNSSTHNLTVIACLDAKSPLAMGFTGMNSGMSGFANLSAAMAAGPMGRVSVNAAIVQQFIDTVDTSTLIFPVDVKHVPGCEDGSGGGFMGHRNGRYHVGNDLVAPRGTRIFAVTYGRVVNKHNFYKCSGEMAYAFFVDYGPFVMNHGEVENNLAPGVGIGTQVVPGQHIAYVGSCRMQHTEMYTPGTTTSTQWWHGSPRPPNLLNPHKFLKNLAKSNGVQMG